jgi:hypothetical protein
MKTIALLLSVFLVLSAEVAMAQAAPEKHHGAGAGPLRIRNTHPLFIAAPTPVMDSARLADSVDALFHYSSTFLLDASQAWTAEVDVETAFLEVGFRKTYSDRLEMSVHLPIVGYQSGFLDDLVRNYHDLIGVDDGRDRRPNNDFLFVFSRNGQPVIRGRAGKTGVGDLRAGLKGNLLAGNPAVSIYGFVEFPTGDAEQGFGNEDFDWGLALLVDMQFATRWTVFANAGAVFTDELDGLQKIHLDDYLYGGLDLQWSYSPRFHLNVQLTGSGSPYDTGIRDLDTETLVLGVGGSYSAGRHSRIAMVFSEDLNTAGAPDFMLGVGYRYVF